jgi:putative ABC transport system ATP-binding protein
VVQKLILEAKNLKKRYALGRENVVHALNGADLTVLEGDFVSLIGASGSGKSTLLHILGFMDRADEGELRFEGRLVTGLKESEMTRIRSTEVGFIFQSFNLIPSLSAWENVAFPARFVSGVSAAQRKARALELLDAVGLGDRAGHRPGELSGGQRQRVAIARSLINQPKILLADEPTGNLDSRTGAQIMELFAGLNAAGQTIILVTHNPEIAAQTQKVYRMKDGILRRVTAGDYFAAD